MRHPTEGTLRRLLDDPAGVADADREHVASCERCARRLAGARDDADVVHAALVTVGPADIDLGAAWQRQSTAAPTAGHRPAVRPGAGRAGRVGRVGRAPTTLRRPALAGVAVATVLVLAGAAAANDWLPIFRTERIAPIGIDTDDLNALPDLRAYGEVAVTDEADVGSVPSAAAAAEATGLDVPEVASLPRGVSGDPRYEVGDEASVTFTFSADRAARAAADAGEDLPAPPPGMDGNRVRLVAGPGLAAIWSGSGGVPDLVVGRAVAPRAFSSSDVPFTTVRDYLLSLPGLPEDTAAILRRFDADGSTLPLPVPADRVTTSSARVGDVEATVLATRDRSLAAVAWVEDGVVTVVAGSLDSDEVLTVARGLR